MSRSEKFMKKRNNQPKKAEKAVRKPSENQGLASDEFVFGMHATIEAIQQGRGNKLFIQDSLKGEKVQQLKDLAAEQHLPIKWVPKAKLDSLSNQAVHQGVVMTITPYEYLSLEQLLAKAPANPFFLVLDSLEDPHNFGSILRTADATGVDGVIIPKHRAVGITPIVVKTSTGAIEHVPIARVTNLQQTLSQLKAQGFWIFGTDMQGVNYRQWNATGSIALIIGNEGKGMAQGLKKEVDQMLTIPMTGHVQSLNASVAASLLMYEAFYQRGAH